MSVICGSYDPLDGIMVTVSVIPDVAVTGGDASEGEVLTGRPYVCKAMVDTGASCTSITEKVARGCGMKPFALMDIITPTGQSTLGRYSFGVVLRQVSDGDPLSRSEVHWIEGV